MKNIKHILNDVLVEIQPDKEYEKEIFKRIKNIIKRINLNQKNIRAILGGSGAKGTWLKTFDADIFAIFEYNKFKNKSDLLADILEKILRKKFKHVARLHGSRDYFQLKQGKFTFEIVPILEIRKAEQALNITDVSPLHSKWVGKHKNLVNDMKLTKQFCQAQNIYGAESYIRGFSGYICEILTVYYRSFLNLIKNAAKWPEKVIIDVEKYYKGKDIFKIVNVSKLISPLIVIDPVQKDRNAAAALSQEKFEAFRKASKQFLINPSKEFFVKKNLNNIFLAEKTSGRKLMNIEVKPLAGKIDVVGGKLFKIYELLEGQSQKHNFKAIKSEWEWDKKGNAHFYFLFNKKLLPKTIEIEGPPIKMQDHVKNFRNIHKKTFVRCGRIYAIENREFVAPEKLFHRLFKSESVKDKCESIKLNVL